MSDQEIKSLTDGVRTIQVTQVCGKKANQAYRKTHPTLRREEANLSQKSLNVPQADPECHKPKET
jgi:hypothetical protein